MFILNLNYIGFNQLAQHRTKHERLNPMNEWKNWKGTKHTNDKKPDLTGNDDRKTIIRQLFDQHNRQQPTEELLHTVSRLPSNFVYTPYFQERK